MKKLVTFVLINLLILSTSTDAREITRADLVKEVNILFLKEDYAGVIKAVEGSMARYRLTRAKKKEALYLEALSYTKTGSYGKAREVLGRILKMKGNEYREEAYIGIADSYYNEGEYSHAIESYEAALSLFPRSDRISSVYYNLALSHKELEDQDKANYYFNKIKEDYGSSFEAESVVYAPTVERQTYYIVQLGAFKSLNNAKELHRQLSRKSFDSYIQKVTRDGDVLYRVRGGKFSSNARAMELIRRLKRSRFQAKLIEE
ncbi:MAG: SPOR domain-containing protein [Candidatus Omnitrophota bacterium]